MIYDEDKTWTSVIIYDAIPLEAKTDKAHNCN